MGKAPGGTEEGPFSTQRLVRLWAVGLPRLLDRWIPTAADAIADSVWMARWPQVAAVAPLAGAALGFLSPFLMPGMTSVYSESLVFLLIAVAVPVVSSSAAAGILVGYVLGDLAHSGLAGGTYASPAGRIVGFALLALLLLVNPLVARRLAQGVPLPSMTREGRIAADGLVLAIAYGVIVYLWCQAMIVLVRPVFTWSTYGSPPAEAIAHVQHQWPALVLTAAAAAVLRVVLESRPPASAEVDVLRAEQAAKRRPDGLVHALAPPARVALGALGTTFILAGLYDSWLDALLVLVITAVLGALRMGLIRAIPAAWSASVQRVPALVRVVLAAFAGYLLALVVIQPAYAGNSGSLRPVLFGALLTLAIFYALFPRQNPQPTANRGAPAG